ncbi:unnamed protein product [Amaranthus hypochondriacus]
MDVIGTVMSVSQTLLAALQCPELKKILSIYGYESQLRDLEHTVRTIKAVFRDAEAKQELSEAEKLLIEDLKDAVFEADDLLDEFVTLAEKKQHLKSDGSLSKKTRLFISRSNPFGIAYKMSKGVKKIRKKLDGIAYNKQFCFEHDPEPIRKRRIETCSYVDVEGIIGRERELEEIIGMLFDHTINVQCNVSFLGIVGIGGLGKTALAQLVYNDPRVISSFGLRLWTCVSDQDQNRLDVVVVLRKILGSVKKENEDRGSTLDRVQGQLRKELAGKKYLLVLDDVWTERREQWCDLIQYLNGCQKGSWIVVTTRSHKTASMLGGLTYELQGLSKENSWRLFERAAFGPYNSSPPDDVLVEIGRKIVDGCARVPLAIRVVGSFLYGQEKSKWESVQKLGLANIKENEDDIMSILELSYHHLESPLKSCFSYCALFPKGFIIRKEMLIRLWIAQGYIVSLDKLGVRNIEEIGEEYFLVLLRRCFFQDIWKNSVGDIVSFKIHDLIHDLAQRISRKEISTSSDISGELDKRVRHVSTSSNNEYGNSLSKTHIRSYVRFNTYDNVESLKVDESFVEKLVENCRYLRALDLISLPIKTLSSSIGKLLHLRYLNLSNNKNLEVLPK